MGKFDQMTTVRSYDPWMMFKIAFCSLTFEQMDGFDKILCLCFEKILCYGLMHACSAFINP